MYCPTCREKRPDGHLHCVKCGSKNVIAKGLFAKNYFGENSFTSRFILIGVVELIYNIVYSFGINSFIYNDHYNEHILIGWWLIFLTAFFVAYNYLIIKNIIVIVKMNKAYYRYCSSIQNSTAKATSGKWRCPKCNTVNSTDYCHICGEEQTKKLHPVSTVWTCSSCNVVNFDYVGTCGCGEGKPK